MKILYVASHSPLGPQYGAQKRSLQILRALQQVGEVSITLAQFRQVPNDELISLRSACGSVESVSIQPAPVCSLQQRVRRAFSARFINTDGHAVPIDSAERLARAVDEHDAVWIHTIRLANVFGFWRWPNSVLDIDDVPSAYWQTKSQTSPSLLEKARMGRLVWQWRRREHLLFERFSVAAVCSDSDKRYLGDDPRIHVIPNGFETPIVRTIAPDANRRRLGMIGTFAYPPNVDGLRWFLNEAWPKVRERLPDAELRIVGNGSDTLDFARLAQVSALGYVDDAAAEIRSWSGMIVPVRIAGGTRVKIAEGFARGCPVIATSLGAYGYDVQHDREMLLADTPEAFAASCVRVLTDTALRDRLAAAAAGYFDQHLSWEALVPRVHKAVQACLDRSHPRGSAPRRDESCLKSPG
ncbi:MAG: glycosyltransferase family 4 protein [Rhodospirillales bacterium]|jgi:glycosyltransferase involved in cell wall biosynthesis|nr:glycosyltransferase family 4 protein [Rhodospirillales bacterium]